MKVVLLLNVVPTLRAYIAKKVHSIGLGVVFADDFEQAFEHLQKTQISLIVLEHHTNREALFDFFEKKRLNSKITDTPTILLADSVSKTEFSLLSSYNVRKILSKPIKVDELFFAMGKILSFNFGMDETPCLLEIRVNEGVLFIEISQGLNKDKLELLQFRLIELIQLYKLAVPKILVMMTDLELIQSDANRLEYLIDNILAIKIIHKENIRFLTMNSFIMNFFKQRANYKDIKVVSSLAEALESLVTADGENEAVAENLLLADDMVTGTFGDLEMRFKMEGQSNWSIAVVDDDPVISKIMASIFADKAKLKSFPSGEAFLSSFDDSTYDLVFLDMMMPGISGIDVLMQVRKRGGKTPFVILSAVTERDIIVKALEKGAKQYVLKPVNKDTILKKAAEVLGAVF